MALPEGDFIVWPPESWKAQYSEYTLHSAWYSGDPDRLANYYEMQVYNPLFPRSFFWARLNGEERRIFVHVPIAGDICKASADLLFSESPKIGISEADEITKDPAAIKAQDRLVAILEANQVQNKLLEGAETCAGLGGVFLKANWDKEVADFPILSIAQADAALPEFRYGFLTACTFWRVIGEDGNDVYRLLERHERGIILYGLYKGTVAYLGQRISLNSIPEETQGLKDTISTGVEDILCRYIPNMRPNRKDRASYLGQADFAGCESLMDSLDETFTSWLRDVRLSQGRIIAPDSFFERIEETDGTVNFRFNLDKEAYMKVSSPPSPDSNTSNQITLSQFAIRSAEHEQTAINFLERIITAAGYSPQTFGLEIAGRAESGTALNLRERKSILTKQTKERYWKPAIEEILELMLQLDARYFSSGIIPYRPQVAFGDSVTPTLREMAESVELLNRAQAATTKTKVRLLHPDWSDEQVEAEAQEISEQSMVSLTEFGPDGKTTDDSKMMENEGAPE